MSASRSFSDVRELPAQDVPASAQFGVIALDGRSGRLSGLVLVDLAPCPRRARLQCGDLALHGVDLALHAQVLRIVRGDSAEPGSAAALADNASICRCRRFTSG